MRNPATHPATLVARTAPTMTADQPLFPDPREAVPLGSYLDLAIWLLGRNPLVADLANRIPKRRHRRPEGTVHSQTRLALTIRARDRLSVAWDEWADANGIPTNDYDERGKWEAVNAATYVGAYADAVAAWDRLDRTGWQADFLDDYRRAATSVR